MRIAINLTSTELHSQPLSGDTTYYHALLSLGQRHSGLQSFPLGDRSGKLRWLIRWLEVLALRSPNRQLKRWLFAQSRRLPILPSDLNDAEVIFSVVLAPRVLHRRGVAQVWYTQGIGPSSYYEYMSKGKINIDDVAAFYGRVAPHMTMLIIGTQDGTDRLRAYCPELTCPIVTIPMPLLLDPIASLAEKPQNQKVRLLFVGTNYTLKGLPETLSAYRLLPRNELDCELHIVTPLDCPLRGEWHDAQDVIWHGLVDSETIYQLYLASDILVIPTYADSYNASICEAMAYGMAIVSSSIPPITEIAPDGLVGTLVSPGDVGRLSEALYELIINLPRRREMMQASLDRYCQRYAPSVVVPKLMDALKDAIRYAHQ